MKLPFTGGCMCGAIRYECSAEPIVMGNCQQATGTAYVAGMLVPRDAVTITGNVKYYKVTGESGGIVSRGFDPNCGLRLFAKPPIPELMSIMAGSLDEPSWFQPTMHIYTASAQPWDYLNPDLPKFVKLPPPESKPIN